MFSPSTTRELEITFIALQAVNVAFLLLHDWVPLGRLNNLAAIRSQDSLQHRLIVALLSTAPAATGLFFTVRFFSLTYPHWLSMLLWITYGFFFLGLLRAWWIPYLLIPDAQRAERYQTIFSGTHTFLPRRNGIAPDTLHAAFHINMVATIAALALLTFRHAL